MVLDCKVDDCSRAAECSRYGSGSKIVRREGPSKRQFHMGVGIDTARYYELARCVKYAVGAHFQPGSNDRHALILYKDVTDVVVDRGNNPPILYKRFHSPLNLSNQAHLSENSSAGSLIPPVETGGWFSPSLRSAHPLLSS